jgi:SurA N-terminal domain/PPIC-type PPIASE domain
MLETLRKRQRVLLIFITVVTIVTFVIFLNPTTRSRFGGQAVIGNVNGKPVTVEDVQKLGNTLRLGYSLGLPGFYELLRATDARTRDEETLGFAWNLLVLRDEAKALQVEPSDSSIRDAEKALPPFQTDGKFDPNKYRQFVTAVGVQGFTPADIDGVVADNLKIEKIVDLISGASRVPESALRRQYELANNKMNLAVLAFKAADYKDNHDFPDAAVNSYYQDHSFRYELPEKRKIEFVAFTLTDNQKKLDMKGKQAVLKSLADNAEAFQTAVSEHPDTFEKTAQEKNLHVDQTGMFTDNDPDPLVAKETGLAHAALALTKDQPVSDVIQGADGFYVAKLVNLDPAHAAPLADVRGQVVAAMKADAVRSEILKEMKAGASFLDAAKKAGVTPETPAPFSIAAPGASQSIATLISQNNLRLDPGDTSDVLADGQNSVFVHLLSREPIDQAAYATFKKNQLPMINRSYGLLAFREWLRVATKKAGGSPLSGYQAG